MRFWLFRCTCGMVGYSRPRADSGVTCPNCEGRMRLVESLLPPDSQPGPLADLFEAVMLASMVGRPDALAATALRALIDAPKTERDCAAA